ncbi:aspartate--tRNA ligase [Candidatus Shapirobacteria bacterium CG09_land_8_20_14_0_10_38_17]|uniref:Aspartate--tRNA(Asp/Asn) ligase n=1 Tax=Candidatus Shapirobacteria bacterium CG09_land_8_20_14_0_10_38_17 TaxID=1974884 RepID=A0A2H0WQL5_9BACT|nr:MAG: aspartate--tRNA ligase [Candidatus Shapirobacteria bacterium CG09_land_8_20_14_0_10_38_17]
MLEKRTEIKDTVNKVSKKVFLYGWVNSVRDHGKLIFVDLRDRSGIIQLVGDNKLLDGLKNEFVLQIAGQVQARPPKLVNPKIKTGKVEVKVEKVKILSQSLDLPFNVSDDGKEINENLRLKYRYLDLRRPRMRKNLLVRQRAIEFIRNWLIKNDFWEIETPILTKATPEGARDFLVPSRLQKGNFYALPQSPQQYKQLLMVAGIEKYFQIARCFRDEDPRADRAYGEFTQLDLEMSFVDEKDILSLTETLFSQMCQEVFPQKHISKKPFPRLTYKEAIKKYKTDKPDLRKNKNDSEELSWCWVVDFPLFEWKKHESRFDAMHHPFTAPKEKCVADLLAKKNLGKLQAKQYDLILNGYEVGGGSIRIIDPQVLGAVFEVMGHTPQKIKEKFGHLLQAFDFGVPPHGGIAAGLDRILMILQNEPSLREVIAFPMTASGQTAVMKAPSSASSEQLKELGIKKSPRLKS